MNKFKMIGVVKNTTWREGTSSKGHLWVKVSWTLQVQNGKKTQWIPCSTWSANVGNSICDGLTVELTHYIPTRAPYVDKHGQTSYWFELEVKELDILEDAAEEIVINDRRYQNNAQYRENAANSNLTEDVLDKLECKEEEEEDEEDNLQSLDWLDDLKGKPKKEEILEDEVKEVEEEFNKIVEEETQDPKKTLANVWHKYGFMKDKEEELEEEEEEEELEEEVEEEKPQPKVFEKDLLTSLKEVYESLKAEGKDTSYTEGLIKKMEQEILEQAKEAVTKAKGELPKNRALEINKSLPQDVQDLDEITIVAGDDDE